MGNGEMMVVLRFTKRLYKSEIHISSIGYFILYIYIPISNTF